MYGEGWFHILVRQIGHKHRRGSLYGEERIFLNGGVGWQHAFGQTLRDGSRKHVLLQGKKKTM
jgi:hypothetical protein